jgi:hypothetical protein
MSDNFPVAYRRARRKVGEDAWPLLTDDQQAEAVAEVLHSLEEESRAAPAGDADKPAGGTRKRSG